jgi:hypothetical protein
MKQRKTKILAFITVVFILLTFAASFEAFGSAAQSKTNSDSSMPLDLIEEYFKEAKRICDADNGALWGENIYSPMLIIDPKTLDAAANEPDNEGKLKRRGNLYIGKFSEDAIASNSTTSFGGKDWSMIIWPMNDDMERKRTMIHEMFHHQQPLLGMTSVTEVDYDNSHMDEMDARISIQLEWNALFAALESTGERRKEAIANALSIRDDRRKKFSSAENENRFEIAEGMAEYTSYKLCDSTSKAQLAAARSLHDMTLEAPSFVRSF